MNAICMGSSVAMPDPPSCYTGAGTGEDANERQRSRPRADHGSPQGSGPALVLLHCLGVDHRLWDIAAAGLERDFTLLTYDFPGHGATPVPAAGYGVAELSAQLARLLEREGIDHAHLGGISLGGLVAQHFAATYPDRVDRLLLLDTTPRYTDGGGQRGGGRGG